MGMSFKCALDGYNAETDTDPNHFSLYIDRDDPVEYILIKEKAVSITSVSGTTNIAHGLGYVPFCLVFAEVSTGVFRKLFSRPIGAYGLWFEVNTTNLVLRNTGAAVNFQYHIFYDNIT